MAEEKKKKEEEVTIEEEEEIIELNGGGGGVWIKDKKKILGRGGCATVYLGRRRSSSLLHQPPFIAVKSVPLWSDDHNLLLEESEIFLELKPSPYIIQFLGKWSTVDKEGNKFFNLCFEYASGGSLHDRIRKGGGLDDEMDVRCYTRSILKGLKHIHDQGFVHCDLKPQNILISHNNVAKIADFGLAVKTRLPQHIRNRNRNRNNNTRYLYRGTHLYVAPEEIHSQSYHSISDIWGLGCTVLEMLTGSDPWGFDPKTTDREDIVRYIAATEVLPMIPENISLLAKDFLSNCLVRDTELRWTVDMLMEHPFIYSIDEDKYVNAYLQKEEEMEEIENKKKKRKREAEEEELKKMKRCNPGPRGIRRRCAEMAEGLNQKSMDTGGRYLGF